jgi:DNA-binding CsgD family transcriptional regulator
MREAAAKPPPQRVWGRFTGIMRRSHHAKTLLQLTERELQCLGFLASGHRRDQIAQRLGIKSVTVDLHVRNARLKLGAKTREQAIAKAVHAGVIRMV